jgi:hypothetical protein
MRKEDINMLDEIERKTLDLSFHVERQQRRVRGFVWSGVAVLVAVVLFWQLGLSRGWLALLAATILGISIAEKVTYQAAMRRYEAVIRKLVRRVEQLEGVAPTPDESDPSRRTAAGMRQHQLQPEDAVRAN